MKLSRLLLPVLLFLIAAPSFALCAICDINCNCVTEQGAGTRCKPTLDCCVEIVTGCAFATEQSAPALFASDYTIASVEVVTPAKHAVTTAAPQLAARTPQPAPRTR